MDFAKINFAVQLIPMFWKPNGQTQFVTIEASFAQFL